ncbi:MAG: response regulator transcription factor, partial [Pedobacter sp.]
MIKIGLAEDDSKIAELIRNGLQEQNFEVYMVHNGADALHLFQTEPFDLVILDLMMPGMNGIEVSKALRKVKPDLPILMLTAMGSLDDKITGFN